MHRIEIQVVVNQEKGGTTRVPCWKSQLLAQLLETLPRGIDLEEYGF